MKICNHDISKSITARSFKLGQLIEGDEWINWWKFILKKELSPFADLPGRMKIKMKKNIFSWSPFADLGYENL